MFFYIALCPPLKGYFVAYVLGHMGNSMYFCLQLNRYN